MKIRIGKLVIGVRWHKNSTDNEVRQELINWMKDKNLTEKEHEFTDIELHYNSLPKPKVGRAWGKMMISCK